MKIIYQLLLVFLLTLVISNLYAQADTIDQKKSFFKAGITFINNNVYLGRADTVKSPTVIPIVSYNFKSGVYVSASLYDVTNRKTKRIDGGDIEVGYNYSFTDNFEAGASFTKIFNSSNSTRVNSSLSSIANAYLGYDIGDVITTGLSANYSFSKKGFKNDVLLNPNLSHDFTVEKIFAAKDVLIISPIAGLNAGTQNFYEGYLTNRVKRTKKTSSVITQTLVLYNEQLTAYQQDLGKFKVLDSEISVPVVYKSGSFIFSLIPTFAFPVNGLASPQTKIQKFIQQGIPPLKGSVFYFESGISIKL